MEMSVANCTMDFNKNLVTINIPSVKIADSSFSLNATALSDIKNEIIIKSANIKSKFINVDNLAMYKDAPIAKLKPLIINEGKLYADKVSTLAYGKPVNLFAASSDIKQ
ncbi:MAG: hypothetical protein MJ231_03185 [bacterium]|nr:hypothetical protein [bacterium]